MAFSYDWKHSIVLPMETFILEQRWDDYAAYWLEVVKLLSNPKIVNVMQNSAHEKAQLLLRHNVEIRNPYEDIMLAHSLLYPELPKGLDYLAASFTFLPYFKQEDKSIFIQ